MAESPVRSVPVAIVWMIAVVIVSLLMVSAWRYPSFKQINVSKPRTPLIVLVVGGAAFLIWEWSQPVLLIMACTYVTSGIVIRIGGIVRRYRRSRPAAPLGEHQIG
jgi:CDP-diacylglycerol--serine O-phosphatidyltransferase